MIHGTISKIYSNRRYQMWQREKNSIADDIYQRFNKIIIKKIYVTFQGKLSNISGERSKEAGILMIK